MNISKEAKSLGLAIAAIPFSFAVLGVMSSLGWIDPHSPSAWSTLKLVVGLISGCAYLFGSYLFKKDDAESR